MNTRNTRPAMNGDNSSTSMDEGVQRHADLAAAAGTTAPATPTKSHAKAEPALSEPLKKPPLPYDEHHGKGGSYQLIDGKRVLVEHTDDELKARGGK
jgi:hypothetical protein